VAASIKTRTNIGASCFIEAFVERES